MQTIDIVMLTVYTALCCMSSYIAYNIRHNGWDSNISFVGSLFLVIWSNFAIRKMQLDLIKINSYTDILCSMTYYIVYFLCGAAISPTQWIGISVMLLGLIIINH